MMQLKRRYRVIPMVSREGTPAPRPGKGREGSAPPPPGGGREGPPPPPPGGGRGGGNTAAASGRRAPRDSSTTTRRRTRGRSFEEEIGRVVVERTNPCPSSARCGGWRGVGSRGFSGTVSNDRSPVSSFGVGLHDLKLQEGVASVVPIKEWLVELEGASEPLSNLLSLGNDSRSPDVLLLLRKQASFSPISEILTLLSIGTGCSAIDPANRIGACRKTLRTCRSSRIRMPIICNS